ncbi:class II histone deacetylase [Siminovitchia sediminis]|uniref:Class II histone deacetylase n=1 Tax=Siminovitchia sediminis TaxID=1274353 RepID=A0ABW4KDL6_9BACI
MSKTGFIYDESYFWHDTGNGALHLPPGGWVQSYVHSENPETKRRFKNLLERSGLLSQLQLISPRVASRDEVELFHSPSYIDKVKELSETTGGDAGEFAIVGPGSYEIALLATGGAITAVDAVMERQVKNVYALTRPPGHHAEAEKGKGFCLFNHIAIAAKYAKQKYNLERILILDWDVHHGNGTEEAFYDDSSTLFISMHQEYNYPKKSGIAEHSGRGEGKGYNVNIPLPAGTGNAGYMHAFKKIVEPIVDQFKPELILISAGQDPSLYDPLGRMMVTAKGFYRFAEFMMELAERHCEGQLVVIHEGGYSAPYVPFCSLSIVEAMSGIKTAVEDPFISGLGVPSDKLFSNQEEAIQRVINHQSKFWESLNCRSEI